MLGGAQQVLAHLRVVGVQLGQRGQVVPGSVAQVALADYSAAALALLCGGVHALDLVVGRIWTQPARANGVEVEVEPVDVRRLGAVLDDMVKRPEAAA